MSKKSSKNLVERAVAAVIAGQDPKLVMEVLLQQAQPSKAHVKALAQFGKPKQLFPPMPLTNNGSPEDGGQDRFTPPAQTIGTAPGFGQSGAGAEAN